MKTTLKIKLCPTEAQHALLKQTMIRFNEACNEIAKVAFEEQLASKFKLQKLLYYRIKKEFSLSAQMVVRAIAKVVEAYKRDKKKLCSFKPLGAVVYDQRIMAFKGLEGVSLWTIDGRQTIPMILGGYQLDRIGRALGQADLALVGNTFYLLATVDTPEQPPLPPEDFLGVDLGIVRIAVDSDGATFSGEQVDKVRQKYASLRSRLQSADTASNRKRNARRHLKKLGKKEARFRRDVNHIVSKKLVKIAKDTSRGIALEDLKGIRERTSVWKDQRARHHGWSFFQLRQFITYKALISGVPVCIVDARDTSRTCPECGFVSKKNRPTQDLFLCRKCGHRDLADRVGALNIRSRAIVNWPIAVVSLEASCKPPALAGGG